MDFAILQQLVILLAAAVLIIYVSHKVKIPSVVGFLLTGVLLGPGGLAAVKETETIVVLAEIGVIMLLFMIGIEFTLERLKKIQRNFWAGGGLQVLLTVSASVLIFVLLEVPLKEAVFFGFLASLSSTAVVLKILSDRGEMEAPQGRLSLGILIFQDMAIVPMIVLVPVLSGVRAASPAAVLLRFLVGGAIIAAAFVVSRFLMPRLLRLIVGTRIREVFLLSSLVVCLGMAWLTSSLGLSLALGAFLAGVVLSESKYSHQVVSDILPFKDVFNSLFFISIGMLLDTAVVWRSRLAVAVILGAVLILKTAIVFLTVRVLGHSPRIALVTGLTLAQIGEFSFVLAGVGRANGLLSDDVFQLFLASSILTILATPFVIRAAPALAARTERAFRWKPRGSKAGWESRKKLEDHVIVAGFGLNGRNLAHVLKEAGIPYVILELNPETVHQASREGEPIIFGDVSSRTILREAGLERAKGMVVAISDPAMTRRAVRAARDMNKSAFLIVRTRYTSEIDGLFRLGADDVIPEEFETSIEIFTRVLEKLFIPKNIIDAQVKVLRGECYGILRGSCAAVRPSLDKIADFMAAGTAETFYVTKGSWPAGKKMKTISLRKKTGATLIAVVRGDRSFASPGADFTIEEGDTLVLVAGHRDMSRAFKFLDTGRTE